MVKAMGSPSWTISGSSVAALLAYAKSRQVDLRGWLQPLGLGSVDLLAPETRVPTKTNDALWAEAVRQLHDDALGLHFAQVLDLDAFHLVGHLALSSRTVGEALERVVEFSRLLHDAGRTELEYTAQGRVLLFPGCRGLPAPPPRHIAEFTTASVVLLVRLVTAEPGWRPEEVRFHHSAPADTSPHRALFGCSPVFDALEDCLVLDEASLRLPVRVAGPSRIGRYLEGYARELLSQLPNTDDSLEAQVRRAIITSLMGRVPSVDEVAQRLGLTARTLQRRLASVGLGFTALVDDVRRASAERYLADGALPLAEISFLLGFTEPSTFHKAFRRWTGQTPGAFRQSAGVGGQKT